MGNKNEELYETIPHLLYIYVRTLLLCQQVYRSQKKRCSRQPMTAADS